MRTNEIPLSAEELKERKILQLGYFDDFVLKLSKLEEEICPLLTQSQKEWLAWVRQVIIASQSCSGMQTRVHQASQLLGHALLEHSIKGYTYRYLAAVLGVTPERVRQICLKEYHRRQQVKKNKLRGINHPRPWEDF